MERFKQTIAKLENDVAELRQFQKEVKGSVAATADVHYCTSTQEFGEYSLDELDTFRFTVTSSMGQNNIKTYAYQLRNPTDELSAYLLLQAKNFSTEYIPINPDNFETHCMTNNGTPFVLTKEIRKCLESKLWEFAADFSVTFDPLHPATEQNNKLYNGIKQDFYLDITIPFTNTYTLSPHVSFYITPLSHMLDEVTINEITTKQVVFRIRYGNMKRLEGSKIVTPRITTIFPALRLHYNINGIVKQTDNLLE